MSDYPYVRAWGKILGLSPEDVEIDVLLAKSQHAPPDAFAKDYRGGWHRIEEMTNESIRKQIISIAEDTYGAPPRDT